MQLQLMVGVVVILLIVLYVYLKRNKGHQESNLPAISEDVNLPVMNQPSSPVPAESQTQPTQNELDNNGPQ